MATALGKVVLAIAVMLAAAIGVLVLATSVRTDSQRATNTDGETDATANDEHNPDPEVSPAASTVTIPVDGMTCAACAARVTRRLQRIPDVADVDVDLARRQVRIHYTDPQAADAFASAIAELGYTPHDPIPGDGSRR